MSTRLRHRARCVALLGSGLLAAGTLSSCSNVEGARDLPTYQADDEYAGAGGSLAQGGGGSGDSAGSSAEAGASGEGGSAPIAGKPGDGKGGDGGMSGAEAAGGEGGEAGSAGIPDCTIDATTFANGDRNPANACLYCDSVNRPSAWAKATDGTDCDTGMVCNSGWCASRCFVGGTLYIEGAGEPGNTTCSMCKPATATSEWTPASEGTPCNSNQFCHNGACAPGCFIAGTFYAAGAVNGCQTCDPGKSRTRWSNADGIACSGGGTCCSNTCVNLQTSNTHCGGCGLACSSGCSAGECVVQLCSSRSLGTQGEFRAIGIDSKDVVYLTHTNARAAGLAWVSTDGNCTSGADPDNPGWESVSSISVTSTGVAYSVNGPPWPSYEMHYIVPGQAKSVKVGMMKAVAVPIASDANNVYWLDFASGAGNVVKAPISGAGPTTALAPISAAGGIAIDASYVYWADNGAVKRVPIATGAVTTLANGLGSPGPLSVDSANLYYTGQSNALFRLPHGSATTTKLMNGGATFAFTAFGPNTFYWTDKSTINSISLSGGAVGTATANPIKVLYTAPTGQFIYTLGVSGRSLYWVESGKTLPILMKLTPN